MGGGGGTQQLKKYQNLPFYIGNNYIFIHTVIIKSDLIKIYS